MRYYRAEYESGYERIERDGATQWADLFPEARTGDFGTFPNRRFLERALPELDLPSPPVTEVLEYGCGTGPAACFLAARGFRVDAIDLVPRAIMLARRFADERGVHVNFSVQDVCELALRPPEKRYDLVVDSYCLQSIVTDADRKAVLAAVRARLWPTGSFLISTAMYEPERSYDPSFRYDERTGTCYRSVGSSPAGEDAVRFGDGWYQPYRRHLKPTALRDELTRAGFRVRTQGGRYGDDVVCVRSDRLLEPRGH